MSSLSIQRAQPGQADALTAVARAAKAHWPYTPAQLAIWQEELQFAPEQIASQPTWITVAGQDVLAVYQLALAGDLLELQHFWVLPAAMGQGIGKGLLAHACQQALHLGHSSLEIDADPNAEGFYLACGAEPVGSVPAPTDTDPGRVRPQLRLDCYFGAKR